MAELLTLENLGTFLMLTLLQAVLGFDNLLYVSLESKRVAADRQRMVRRFGIGLAIVFRILLLFAITKAISHFTAALFGVHWRGVFEAAFSLHALIVLIGGVFIMYTAMKEIFHLLSTDDLGGGDEGYQRSVGSALFWIVAMNLVFSFDSILSAIALTKVFVVMALAIVASGVMMVVLADHVAAFLARNRMFEVLGLFILFLVGVMLLSEGGHLAGLEIAGYEIMPMTKSTFYFVLAVLVIVDVVQLRYQKKLTRPDAEASASGGVGAESSGAVPAER